VLDQERRVRHDEPGRCAQGFPGPVRSVSRIGAGNAGQVSANPAAGCRGRGRVRDTAAAMLTMAPRQAACSVR